MPANEHNCCLTCHYDTPCVARRYPLAPVDADSPAPDGDARIHGEIVTLLMKDVNAISKDLHQQLGTSLTVFAKKNGITTVRSPASTFVHVAAWCCTQKI